jgi:hypothetical protein
MFSLSISREHVSGQIRFMQKRVHPDQVTAHQRVTLLPQQLEDLSDAPK